MTPTPLPDANDETRYGGKAASLARSLRAGLPVPPGFALAASDVDVVRQQGTDAFVFMREPFVGLGGPCAVRSSAVGEDSEVASFAGQHATILNVRNVAGVVDAVRQVWESAQTESAKAYRRAHGLDESPKIGAVVQRMIEPDIAGVMFTKNPINGADERVIEASWGLGEAVVSGLVVPDNYVLDRTGIVLRRTAGEKDLALRSAPDGGTVEEPVSADLAAALCLSDDALAQLDDLARRCESFFGAGLDIEWAFSGGSLFLLQCRPMTRNR